MKVNVMPLKNGNVAINCGTLETGDVFSHPKHGTFIISELLADSIGSNYWEYKIEVTDGRVHENADWVKVCSAAQIIDFEFKLPANYSKWQMETEISDKHPMGHVNYFHVEEDSQYFNNLDGLLSGLKRIHQRLKDRDTDKGLCGRGDKQVFNSTSAEEDVADIIKGLENSIAAGYKIVDPAPEGMITIHAPVGSHIITPNMEFIPISAQVFESMGFHYDGICWYRDGVYIGNYKGGYFHVPQTLANRGEKILYKHQVERLLNK